jgi:hypothetical protein
MNLAGHILVILEIMAINGLLGQGTIPTLHLTKMEEKQLMPDGKEGIPLKRAIFKEALERRGFQSRGLCNPVGILVTGSYLTGKIVEVKEINHNTGMEKILFRDTKDKLFKDEKV